jgi:parallel beta-helix repeat protein
LTITYAISKANPSSVINVAAGTYPEQVTISGSGLDGLTIKGHGAASTIIEPSSLPASDTDTDSSQPQFAIIDVNGATGVTIEDLAVNGTDAQGQFTGCGDGYVGVYYHDASGAISKATLTGVDLPPSLFECQQGQSVYVASDPTGSSTVTMSKVTVTNFDKNGITCDDPNTTCTITKTTVTGDGPVATAQNGIQVYDAAATLSKDSVSDVQYTGGDQATGILVIDAGAFSLTKSKVTDSDTGAYLLEDSGPGWILQNDTTEGIWTVSKNTVTDATNNGDGIDVDSAINTVTVSGNKVEDNAGNGISLYGATDTTVSNTTATGNGNGIYLGAGTVGATANGNTISGNTASSNTNDGILADTSSTGNTFSGNSLKHNTVWDAQDRSGPGAGTGGTDNTWTGNHCLPSGDGSPAAIC